MSTSLPFHAFGIQGFQLKKSEFANGNVVFRLEQDRHNLGCSICKSSRAIARGKRDGTFRSIPIGTKKTFVALPRRRMERMECGAIRPINLNFAEPRKRHARAFRRYALSLLEFSTVKDVVNRREPVGI